MLKHNYLGTEHLLLGLIHEGRGVAAVRERVKEIIGQGHQTPSEGMPLTPRAKRVLNISAREAKNLGHRKIGTGHVLLGLLRESDGVGAQVLIKLGADPTLVREHVTEVMTGEAIDTVCRAARGSTGGRRHG